MGPLCPPTAVLTAVGWVSPKAGGLADADWGSAVGRSATVWLIIEGRRCSGVFFWSFARSAQCCALSWGEELFCIWHPVRKTLNYLASSSRGCSAREGTRKRRSWGLIASPCCFVKRANNAKPLAGGFPLGIMNWLERTSVISPSCPPPPFPQQRMHFHTQRLRDSQPFTPPLT